MTDPIAVALITGISAVLQVGLRLWSHNEHKSTSQDVRDIKNSVNGDLDARIHDAVKRALDSKGSNQ